MKCWFEGCETVPNVFCDCTDTGVLVCVDHLLDHMCVQNVEHKYEPLDVLHNLKARREAEKQLVSRISELIRKKTTLIEGAKRDLEDEFENLKQALADMGESLENA